MWYLQNCNERKRMHLDNLRKHKIRKFLCAAAVILTCTVTMENWNVNVVHCEETQQSTHTLMDDRQQLGENTAAWYIPNEEIEAMRGLRFYPMTDDTFLAVQTAYDEGGRVKTEIKRIRLTDGSLVAETDFVEAGFVKIQINGDQIGCCDQQYGCVLIFDENLNQIAYYPPNGFFEAGNNGYLSSDLKQFYQVRWNGTVSCERLEDGNVTEVLSGVSNLTSSDNGRYVLLSYLNLQTQCRENKLLDLQTGNLEDPPIEKNIMTAFQVDDTWLFESGTNWENYYLVSETEEKKVVWNQGKFELITPKAHLLAVNELGTQLSLYEMDGTFLSQCNLPDGYYYTGSGLIWSDEWNGYFFAVGDEENNTKLIFWNMTVKEEGTTLTMQTKQTLGGTSADASLYERATAIGEQYGVDIRIADQCQLDYGYYESQEATDSSAIENSLAILEKALSAYPNGFIKQLAYDSIRNLQFEFVYNLEPRLDMHVGDSAAAFALEQADSYLIVFDVSVMDEGTVYHELTHVIDKRLAWDASLREGALFSEDTWMTLNPEGFEYANTYDGLPEALLAYTNSGYFVSEYSMTFPTEDRATMMEMAMQNDIFKLEYWAGMRNKLAYYSNCIRDCFDTTGWPEETVWEQAK